MPPNDVTTNVPANDQTPPPPANDELFKPEDDKPSTALAPSDATHAFEPQSLGQLYRASRMLVASGLLPKSIKTPAAAMAMIIKGRELGLTMMQSVSGAQHIIEGRVCQSADLMVAIAKRSARCRYFRQINSTNEEATFETWREGDPEPTRLTWTINDAKIAGLLGKDNWKHYPAAMLRARCKSNLAKAVYEKELLGLVATEEALDGFIDAEVMAPEVPVPTQPAAATPEQRAEIKTTTIAERVAKQVAEQKAKPAAEAPSQ